MANTDLGTKRVCPVTGRKFYDLNKDPIVSPYTGQSYPRTAFEPTARAATAKPEAEDEEEDEVEAEGAAKPETVSLEDAAAEEGGKDLPGDDIEIEDSGEADDTFLEQEEESDDDVSGLIDSEIEPDEET